MDNGMTQEEYDFFLDQKLRYCCIMGNDYYFTNEHMVNPDGSVWPSGEIFGYGEITSQYYERYRLPVMHTETNFTQGPNGDEAVSWLRKEWANILQARFHRVPIVGFTWYSLTDQMDWDTALREKNNRVCAVGLFDLDRRIRPVGQAYQNLIQEWGAYLPMETVCLTVPIAFPE
jgi:beta-glucosidase/6-phospho-beta-glucosidase/beta-galactosidase